MFNRQVTNSSRERGRSQGSPSRSSANGASQYSRWTEDTVTHSEMVQLTPSYNRGASLSPQLGRRKYSSELPIGATQELPSNQAVTCPGGATAGRHIDTTRSMRRYSLFGPNVAPFWEYYIGVPGVVHIPSDTPGWKVSLMQKKNCQIVHIYMRKEEEARKRREFERIQQERRACVPEWMKEISERRRQRSSHSAMEQQSSSRSPKNKEELPPWQRELLMRKRRQH